MLFHMHLQITRPFAGVVALLAGKRFLAGVWKHVILHTTVVATRIVALFTSKGLFSSVSELVSLQILRLSGGIVTLLTTERLLSWMDSHANHIILFCSNQGSPSFSKLSKLGPGAPAAAARRQKTLHLEFQREKEREAFHQVWLSKRSSRVGRAFIWLPQPCSSLFLPFNTLTIYVSMIRCFQIFLRQFSCFLFGY